MREQRKQFKIGEVQFVNMDEDDKLLKNAGDEMMQAFVASGESVYNDYDFDEKKAKEKMEHKNYGFVRV